MAPSLAIILILLSPLAYAQEQSKGDTTQHQIPINLNKVDEQGRKTGKRTILMSWVHLMIQFASQCDIFGKLLYQAVIPYVPLHIEFYHA